MFVFLIVVATLMAAFSGFNAVMAVIAARECFDKDVQLRNDARHAGLFFVAGAFSSGYLAYMVLSFAL
jgi:hypothetical protein